MWCTKIGLDTIDIGVKLVADYLGYLCLSEILLNDARLSLLHLLLLCLCGRERLPNLFNKEFKATDIGFFDLFIEGDGLIILIFYYVCYRDIYVFCERLEDLVKVYDADKIKNL